MPELPEVQTVVSDLNKKVLNRRIVKVWTDWPKSIKDPLDQSRDKVNRAHVKFFEKAVKGLKILRVKRRAKNILIYLSNDMLLLIHQKMTGHLLVGKWRIVKNKPMPVSPPAVVNDPYNRFIHLIFYLDNGSMLALSDLRKFAKVLFGSREEIERLPELVNLGPEPLDKNFKFSQFVGIIHKEKRPIKQVLLDPVVIAGIGNIYSDEILWRAKVYPLKPANSLDNKKLKAVYLAMKEILNKAVKLRGTSTSDFRDTAGLPGSYTDARAVYQREGESCPRCGAPIKRIKIGGRSAHFCPKCQAK